MDKKRFVLLTTYIRYSLLTVICLSLLGALGYTDSLETMKPLKRVIEAKAEGVVVHYQKESFWDKDHFLKIIKSKANFESEQIKEFKDSLSKYGKNAANCKMEFNESKRTTLMICDVHGAISKRTGDRYYSTFGWLIRPLGLDFINDNFKESKKGLSWEGTVDNIPTTITVQLPPQDVIYSAWTQPIGHCHAHAWWIWVPQSVKATTWGSIKSKFRP